MNTAPADTELLILLTADIVMAHISNNEVGAADIPVMIRDVHAAFAGLGAKPVEAARLVPAVSIRASIRPDHLVCLEDGRKLKMLKRHLRACYNLTPDEYRARWDLPADYPMVAPDYSAERSALAKKIGLGRMPVQRRGRKKKAG